MAIQVLKLVTGEDVVGDVEFSGDTYNVKNPICVFMRPNPEKEGSFKLGVAPWAPYCNGPVPIFKESVLSVFNPDETLMKEYERRSDFIPRQVIKEPEVLNEAVQ
jgi:hypothetical protein